MKIYLDTGIFIDYLTPRGHAGSNLRAAARNGRPAAQLVADAEECLKRIAANHKGVTSALTCYEVEEALYKKLAQASKGLSHASTLVIAAARGIVHQVVTTARLHNIDLLELTADVVHAQLREPELTLRGVRAADALHVATAIRACADVIVSGDAAILALDGLIANASNALIRCCDSDICLTIL